MERLQIRDEIDELLRREDALHAPRRHDGVGERHARVPEMLVEICIGQLAIASVERSGPTLPAGHTSSPGTR